MCSRVSVHTLAAALGISAVFYSSAIAFQAVKYLGSAYLLFLACKAIKESGLVKVKKNADTAPSSFALYRRGFLMNVLNPKVALFFLAFLPQFTSRNAGNIVVQMILLGRIYMGQAVVIFTLTGYFSGTIGNVFIEKPRISKVFGWLSAGIFLALGIRLALTEK